MLQLFKNRSSRAFVPIIADQAACVADCRSFHKIDCISRSIFPSAISILGAEDTVENAKSRYFEINEPISPCDQFSRQKH
jgi:hypothetical protein